MAWGIQIFFISESSGKIRGDFQSPRNYNRQGWRTASFWRRALAEPAFLHCQSNIPLVKGKKPRTGQIWAFLLIQGFLVFGRRSDGRISPNCVLGSQSGYSGDTG